MTKAELKPYSGVIWITGFSSSGKTTVARKVCRILKEKGLSTIFLDGDDLRSIFSNSWGYDKKDRVELAKIYFRLCSHLSSQGYTVVISAIAMYREIRDWVKENVNGAMEVYLSVPEEVRRERDKQSKGVYRDSVSTSNYDVPDDPDLKIYNFAQVQPEDAASAICRFYLKGSSGPHADKGRRAHWENYYLLTTAPESPSDFAKYTQKSISKGSTIIEVGCGNGRDARYFHQLGLSVTAIDPSETAITKCAQESSTEISFFTGTLKEFKFANPNSKFDAVYSRFSLHAMTEIEEMEFLDNSSLILNKDGIILIECRSINDPLARKGEILSPTERVFGHYRRFIIMDELISKLINLGFLIKTAVESNGLARYLDEDPVVIRVSAIKH
jgi:bifunctional enzyme CysN/CysC